MRCAVGKVERCAVEIQSAVERKNDYTTIRLNDNATMRLNNLTISPKRTDAHRIDNNTYFVFSPGHLCLSGKSDTLYQQLVYL